MATNASAVAANQIIGNSVASSTATLTFNGGLGSSTFAGTIQDGIGGSGGQTALAVAGGLLNLSGSNTYSGVTTVSGGTLQLGSATALYAGAATNNLNVNGTFDLNGNNAAVNGLNDLIGTGLIVNSSATAGTLTVGNNNATTGVFSGVLQGSTLNLNKTGSGTQTILGTNNAAATTVSQGVLQFGNGAVNGLTGTRPTRSIRAQTSTCTAPRRPRRRGPTSPGPARWNSTPRTRRPVLRVALQVPTGELSTCPARSPARCKWIMAASIPTPATVMVLVGRPT